MGVYIKNITKDDLGENAVIWGKRIIFIPPEDIIPMQDHGDLIERDAPKGGMDDKCDCETCVGIEEAIKCADAVPVIIPAEKSEEECEDENWYTELDDPKIEERSEE